MKTAIAKKENIAITWRGSGQVWKDTLEVVRGIPGRKWNNKTKIWHAPNNSVTVQILKENGFKIDGDPVGKPKPKKPSVSIINKLSETKLYPYQKEGVQWLSDHPKALLADEMGLGKTAQVLFHLKMHPELRPVLIIVPASLKMNWQKEAAMWIGAQATIINGGGAVSAYGQITIINYDILNTHLPKLKKQNYRQIVIEECHYVKNKTTNRAKATRAICKGVENIIAISGTPITNRPSEFFNTLNMLDRNIFSNFWHFGKEFCGAKHNGFGWDFSGATNQEKLHKILVDSFMIRRKKEEVLKDLPAKTMAVVPFCSNRTDEYKQAREDLMASLHGGGSSGEDVLVMISKMRQLAAEMKKPEAFKWIEDFLESDQKIVLFAVHHKMIDSVMEKWGDIAVKLDGRDSQTTRDKAITEFQTNPKIKIFIGNIKAAGVGITLTAASNVAFLELCWTPGELQQAIDRCHRIGQKDAVTAWILVAAGTIEEEMAEMIDQKKENLDAILDGKQVDEKSLISVLLQKYREKIN